MIRIIKRMSHRCTLREGLSDITMQIYTVVAHSTQSSRTMCCSVMLCDSNVHQNKPSSQPLSHNSFHTPPYTHRCCENEKIHAISCQLPKEPQSPCHMAEDISDVHCHLYIEHYIMLYNILCNGCKELRGSQVPPCPIVTHNT